MTVGNKSTEAGGGSKKGFKPKEIIKEVTYKDDFRIFLAMVWAFLGLPPPTPVQYQIAEYLQYGPKRQIIEGFRGVGKSWITSAYVVWSLLRNPQLKFLVVSASKSRADDFSTFTQRLIIEMPQCQALLPKKDQRWSKTSFDVGPATNAHAPSVKSLGITSQLTGSRANEILADDVEVVQNSLTQDMRDKLLKAVTEFEAIIVPEVGKIKFLGTPQTEESIYNSLREKGYTARIWPSRFPSQDQLHIYNGGLAPEILKRLEDNPDVVGRPTDPKRFTDADLLEREAAYGRSGFALQFQLDTSLSDAEKYPLKLADLIVMGLSVDKAPIALSWGSGPSNQYRDVPNVGFSGDRLYRPMFIDSKWADYEGSVMAIDPSGRGSDELGWAIVNQLHGFLYVLDCGGFKGGYNDLTLINLAMKAKEYGVNAVVTESNFGDGMFTKILTPIMVRYHRCAIEEVRHSTQKERRIIDTLEPVMNRHKLVIDEGLVRREVEQVTKDEQHYSLLYQMTRLTKERGALRHDDRLDALAIAVNYWVEAMARDEVKAALGHEAKLLDNELKIFMKHCVDKSLFNRSKVALCGGLNGELKFSNPLDAMR